MSILEEVKALKYWILFGLLFLIVTYLYIQNNVLIHTTYKLSLPKAHPKLKDKKIVFFSDTHFRNRNSHTFYDRLIAEIEDLEPDLILFGGDIVHASSTEMAVEHAKDFFFQVGKIAPCYVIYGNHDLSSARVRELQTILKLTGVHVLDNEATWVSFGPTSIGFWLMGLAENQSSLQTKSDVLSKIELPKDGSDAPKILLAHHPQYFEKYLTDESKRPDLVLSGHTHGGQVILPFIGGLFAPGQGVNPEFDFGIFNSEQYPSSRLILTKGVGNSTFPFRVNNRPELVAIEFE